MPFILPFGKIKHPSLIKNTVSLNYFNISCYNPDMLALNNLDFARKKQNFKDAPIHKGKFAQYLPSIEIARHIGRQIIKEA